MKDVLERYRAMLETPSVFAVDPSALLRDMAAEIERLRSPPLRAREGCKTPGAIYHIRIISTGINAGVSLPRGITLAGLLDPLLDASYRERPDVPNIGKMYENIIHDALEVAVAKIIALNAQKGGER